MPCSLSISAIWLSDSGFFGLSAATNCLINARTAVLDALRAHDAEGARTAMRAHLAAVLDSLLFATEEQAIREARLVVEAKRQRYRRVGP